jgi:hypothetical protein
MMLWVWYGKTGGDLHKNRREVLERILKFHFMTNISNSSNFSINWFKNNPLLGHIWCT